MIKFSVSVCAEMMFMNFEFADRIVRLKKNGVDAIEFWQWRNKSIDETDKACRENNVEVC